MSTINSILRAPELVTEGIARDCHFKAGEMIVEAGSEDREVYLIGQGLVRVSGRVELDDRKRVQPALCDLGADEIFGELSLFEAGPRSASVVAVEQTALKVFNAEGLSAWFDIHPQQGYVVLKGLFASLNARLRTADRRLESLFAWGLKAHGIEQHL